MNENKKLFISGCIYLTVVNLEKEIYPIDRWDANHSVILYKQEKDLYCMFYVLWKWLESVVLLYSLEPFIIL